jgi:long-chain acyl-CoA synthetase
LYEIGKKNLIDYNSEDFKVLPDDCITFSYTSGTTGPPKGAMISHKNFASFIGSQRLNKDCNFQPTDVALSYLPLPHILEREFDYALLACGARIVFFSGDVQKLKDDLAVAKPTVFLSVPRLFSRFYDVIKGKFNDLQGFTKTAVDYALKTKLDNLKSTGAYTHNIYDRVFFNKTKEALGGRVRTMISGSAPLLPEVQNLLKVCMCCPLVEGYGQTETTGAITISDSDDPEVRHVGGPIVINFLFRPALS